MSHVNGFKLDIRLSACHYNYITGTYKYLGARPGDNAPMYEVNKQKICQTHSNFNFKLHIVCCKLAKTIKNMGLSNDVSIMKIVHVLFVIPYPKNNT